MNFDYDVNKLNAAYNQAKENSKNFDNEPLPEGVYRVKVEKIELGKTSDKSKQPGCPMGKIQFRILEGEHKKQCLFMNKLLVCNDKNGNLTCIGLKIFDDFLNSLQPRFEVSFSSCKDGFKEDAEDNYQNLLLDVAEDIADLTYDIELTYNGDFPEYKVIEFYE